MHHNAYHIDVTFPQVLFRDFEVNALKFLENLEDMFHWEYMRNDVHEMVRFTTPHHCVTRCERVNQYVDLIYSIWVLSLTILAISQT